MILLTLLLSMALGSFLCYIIIFVNSTSIKEKNQEMINNCFKSYKISNVRIEKGDMIKEFSHK